MSAKKYEYTPNPDSRWERMVKEFKRIVAKAVDSVAKIMYNVFAMQDLDCFNIIHFNNCSPAFHSTLTNKRKQEMGLTYSIAS